MTRRLIQTSHGTDVLRRRAQPPWLPVDLRFRDQRPHDGARIRALETVLTAMPAASFIIEVQTYPQQPNCSALPVTLADAVLAVVDRTVSARAHVLESFDWRVQRHVARTQPEFRPSLADPSGHPPATFPLVKPHPSA
jgi:hypothetical protein